jgi:hypothetical protein
LRAYLGQVLLISFFCFSLCILNLVPKNLHSVPMFDLGSSSHYTGFNIQYPEY